MVPNNRTLGSIGIRTSSETTEWLQQNVLPSPRGNRLIDAVREIGVRRTISASRPDGGGPSRRQYAEFHADGCGFASIQLHQRSTDQTGNAVQEWLVDEAVIVDLAVGLTGILTSHALRRGAAGEAIAEFGILGPGPDLELPTALVNDREHGFIQATTERRLTHVPRSQHTFDLGAAGEDVTALLLTARMLVTDVIQAFGLAEVLHIDEEGGLRFNYFGASRDRVRQWAERYGAKPSDATSVN